MQCTSPVIIRNPKYDFGKTDQPQGFLVPCGRCMACRISTTREWTVRMMNESYDWEATIYVTLTYAPEYLPENGSIKKRDAQLFLKRLRKLYPNRKFKYYLAGEYGDESSRPHYHVIFFGLNDFDYENICKAWGQGIVDSGAVEHDSIQYVAGYVQKKFSGELAKEIYQGREAPFHLVSKGLGKNYVLKNEEQIRQKMCVTQNGNKMGLPRYYKKVLALETDLLKEKALEREAEFEERAKRRGAITEYEKACLREESREQNKKTLEAKNKLYARKGV